MGETLPDFVHGPLDFYRKRASFDWKTLKIFLDTENVVRFENDLHQELQNVNAFKPNLQSPSLNKDRYTTLIQAKALKTLQSNKNMNDPRKLLALTRTITQLSSSCSIKSRNTFSTYLKVLGTETHRKLLEDSLHNKIVGCVCFTEVANDFLLQTKAIYNKFRKCFVIHTPDFGAAKFWCENLGQTATHAIVFAQMIIDDKRFGLHGFVVPLREVTTLLPFSGVTIGDLGEKKGLNGVDHGFVVFNQYKVARTSLLDKYCDITGDGKYISRGSSIDWSLIRKDLLHDITRIESFGTKAITITIRYMAVQKQLELQNVQYKLLPYLAFIYILRNVETYLASQNDNLDLLHPLKYTVDVHSELKILYFGVKMVAQWTIKDSIQECSQLCGKHGCLKVSGLGDIQADYETVETNQDQTCVATFLSRLWPLVVQNHHISSPLESVNFLSNYTNLTTKEPKPDSLISLYDWLVVYLTKQINNKPVYTYNLTNAFIERFLLSKWLQRINEAPDPKIRTMLTKIFNLYAFWRLEKHIPIFYQGGLAKNSSFVTAIHESIQRALDDFKNEAVALVDVIAPPDFIVNSVLGNSDGEVYKRIESALYRIPNGLSRPTWWQDILGNEKLSSKL